MWIELLCRSFSFQVNDISFLPSTEVVTSPNNIIQSKTSSCGHSNCNLPDVYNGSKNMSEFWLARIFLTEHIFFGVLRRFCDEHLTVAFGKFNNNAKSKNSVSLLSLPLRKHQKLRTLINWILFSPEYVDEIMPWNEQELYDPHNCWFKVERQFPVNVV